ncbi:hypothetical protein SUGI_0394060 [Cryptomeria japonica]|uniref:transcription factor-like protein DPB n=1 Tax=Cryptomeria japonica TaxID=3369 RepID=UPI002408B0FE|nr:transcription factor-like protein DPB [Cryptomeria japonica]GLJ21404.1 hypothetical protein SUGI_0394060 [Cryptomeria japonica]
MATDEKEIQWKGSPTAHLKDIEQLKAERERVITRINEKRAYLHKLEEQITGLQNLVLRNERASKSGNHPPEVVELPFILVKTQPHATVDIAISEDMKLAHVESNSMFELHDDACILKAMQFCKTP